MDEAKEIILDFKALDVEACRICLATDIKLYTSLQGIHLRICMESISGFTKSYEGLPNYVCYECAPILLKCCKLIEKCKTAEATLIDIFKENGQINKPLIQEQKKTKLELQSSLDSHLLLNYFYIKYDDDSNTSDFIKIESDTNETININLKNEIKEESSDEVSDAEILKMLNEMSKDEELDQDNDGEAGKDSDVEADKDSDIEADKDSDVEAIEVDVPVVEIVSDDEKMGDDFVSLKSYKVEMDNRAGLVAHLDDIPRYLRPKKVRPIGVAKKGKKKKKKKTVPEGPSPFACNDQYIRRYFNVHPTPLRSTPLEYSCKNCPDTFKYVDDAKDHTFIGCQKPQRRDGETSTAPNPGPESWIRDTIGSVPLNQPNIWKEWPGGSK